MARKAIDVFENDYETLLLRAGEPNKIAFVVRELITLSNACAADIKKQTAWNQATLDEAMPSTHETTIHPSIPILFTGGEGGGGESSKDRVR